MTLIVLLVGAAALFLLAFVSKRRFGVLGLGLSAGALLNLTLNSQVSDLLEKYNIFLHPLTSDALAACILTLLPAVLLLFGGPRYSDKKQRLIGSIGFAVLALLLLLGPLSGALILDESSQNVLNQVAKYEAMLVAAGVAAAVVDMIMAHAPRIGRSKKH